MVRTSATSRLHDDHLDRLASTEQQDLTCCAVNLLGPRERIDKLVRRLALLP